MKQFVALTVALCFCLCTGLAGADQYLVVKDKKGKCKVEVFRADKGTIIAGPFDSKDEAVKARTDKCPEAAQPKKEDKKSDKKEDKKKDKQ